MVAEKSREGQVAAVQETSFLVHDLCNLATILHLELHDLKRHIDDPASSCESLARLDQVSSRISHLIQQLEEALNAAERNPSG